MKVLIRLSALLSVIIVSACTQERLELSSGLQQINKVEARVSEMPQTKAHLEEGTKIVWDLSDQIGVYRPTLNSTMRAQGNEQFNAPSRYAIWYRIGKLAYGSGWNGTYEDFVAWDQAHPKSAPAYKARRNYVEKETTPLAPPVIVGHSWKED